MSVLSPPPSGNNYAFSMLTLQMETANKINMQKRGETVGGSYNTKINSIEREQAQWKTVSKDVGEATTKLSSTIGRLRQVLTKIDAMMNSVTQAGIQKDEGGFDSDVFAASFDAQYRSLSKALEESSAQPNLLGSAEPTMSYRISPTNEMNSVTGTSINGDYYIIDSDEKKWVLDRDAGTLKRYDSYPDEPTSTVGSLQGGISLDSLSGDQITFTIAPDTASPETFSGTLHSDGLPVYDTWFYDNLASEDNRSEAMEALESAKAIVKYQISRYETEFAVAQFYEERANDATSGLNSEKNTTLIEKATAVGEAQEEMNRQYEAAINRVATAAKMQNNFTNLFKSMNQSASYKLFSLLS